MAIQLTKRAADRVRDFLDRDGGIGLRLGVKRTGCSGWAYTVQLAEAVSEHDVVFEDRGVKIVVAHDNLDILDGSEVDFADEGLGRTFRFRNPNVAEECGCGESFTVN
ncbi:HesB/IscA family protein [Elongatibacter sediminis]|uniref:Iron-sulfur cluster assembly accessory protein n=1 Tax=Elongatibacter sediminis TaxID=3119006 RepID=A0AAW9RF32_9GAMM